MAQDEALSPLDAATALCDPQAIMHKNFHFVLLAAALVSGCVTLQKPSPQAASQAQAAAAQPAAPVAPALAATMNAAPGARARVVDPDLGGDVTITVVSDYTAASGRRCKRVAIQAAAGSSTRVACWGQTG